MVKLVECKNCRGMVADYAKQCPACNTFEPASKAISILPVGAVTGSSWVNLISGAIVLLLIFGLYSCMKESPEEKREKAAAAAKREQAGFHCLSGWDGSHSGLVRQVKQLLRDPASFEHVSTKLTPVDEAGRHMLFMRYTAKNGFGGMTPGFATAILINASCDATLTNNE